MRHPIVQKADILHLHWVAGMIDYTKFFKQCNKKIVWTLHDMNPIRGLFFYNGDECVNNAITAQLNREVFDIKLRAYNSIHTAMHITSPSMWLTEIAKNALPEKVGCETIPNIVDLVDFYPQDRNACRHDLNIDPRSIVLLFAAMSVLTKRKGFDLLIEALSQLRDKSSIEIIAVGSLDMHQWKDLPLKFTGEIKDKDLLAKYYSAADVFLLPSREDNLPNTMLEAFACGLPVIGFKVGGIKEYIINGKTGYLAEEVSCHALAEAIGKFIKNRNMFSRESIRLYAEENFSKEKIVPQFQKLYNQLLSEN